MGITPIDFEHPDYLGEEIGKFLLRYASCKIVYWGTIYPDLKCVTNHDFPFALS